jgi:hypothetical protein
VVVVKVITPLVALGAVAVEVLELQLDYLLRQGLQLRLL